MDAVESAALLGNDGFLPLLLQLRDWWDVDSELLERAISRCEPLQRAAFQAQWQELLGAISEEFNRSPMRLIGIELDADDPNDDLDRVIHVEWQNAAGAAQLARFALDHVRWRDDVRADAASAARRIVEMLGTTAPPPPRVANDAL